MTSNQENIVFGEEICNNIAISTIIYTKISKNTTITNVSALRPYYYNDNSISLSTVLTDNTHDHLSPLGVTHEPVNDNIIIETKSLNMNKKITDIISEYGKCVNYDSPGLNKQVLTNGNTEFNPITAPYDIPNNNYHCLIRDCFDGTWLPGLNNVFDQASASLKSFIDYHNNRNSINIINPLNSGGSVPGGIGQQLFAQKEGSRHLIYTAYFNYDLLWFKYITEIYFPLGQFQSATILTYLLAKVNSVISSPPGTLLTPQEIMIINTVNINFLWCHLMIYCYNCLADDEFFKNNTNYALGYFFALQRFTQFRFDSFETTLDGYISNPYLYYRGTGKSIVFKEYETPLPNVGYIENMCTQIYTRSGINGFGVIQPVINDALAGGVQYITSQAMASTCMSRFLQLMFAGRSKSTADAVKTACINEINTLLMITAQNGVATRPEYAGYGWALLKFSGDSSHIVFGTIMEKINTRYAGTQPPIEIIYAVSERPLAARLLAAGKNVYSAMNSVFSTHFNGPGSENTSISHAVLYIQWDTLKTLNNIIEGLTEKIDFVTKKLREENNIDGLASIEKYNEIYKSTILQPTVQNNTPDILKTKLDYLNNYIKTDNETNVIIDLYNNYKLKGYIYFAYISIKTNGLINLVTYFGGTRGAGHTKWLAVMKAFNDDVDNIKNEFNLMATLVNLMTEYYVTAETDVSKIKTKLDGLISPEVNFVAIFGVLTNFQKIFKKIIKANLNTIIGGKNNVKIDGFRLEREREWWLEKKSGDGIPGKVDSIISRMELLLTNCFKIYDFLKKYEVTAPPIQDLLKNTIMKGGGDYNHSGGGVSGSILTQNGGDPNEENEAMRMIIDALTYGNYSEPYKGEIVHEAGSQDELIQNDYVILKGLFDTYIEIIKDSSAPFQAPYIYQIYANRLKGSVVNDVESINNETFRLFNAIHYIGSKYLGLIPGEKRQGFVKTQNFMHEIITRKNTQTDLTNEGNYQEYIRVNYQLWCNELRSLKDIKEDSDINFKSGTYDNMVKISLQFNQDNIKPNKLKFFILALSNSFPNYTEVFVTGESDPRENIYNILLTLTELSKDDGGVTMTQCLSGIDDINNNIMEIIGNRNYVSRLISILGPHVYPDHNYNTRTTRLDKFINTFIYYGQLGGRPSNHTLRKRSTRKLLRRDNRKIANKPSRRRVSPNSRYKSKCRNKTKNMKRSNNKKTRRKRRY